MTPLETLRVFLRHLALALIALASFGLAHEILWPGSVLAFVPWFPWLIAIAIVGALVAPRSSRRWLSVAWMVPFALLLVAYVAAVSDAGRSSLLLGATTLLVSAAAVYAVLSSP